VIDREQPDVLALQEIGPDGALQALRGALATPMPNALAGQPDGRGIRVAFLSRLPFTSSAEIRPFPTLIQPVQQKDQIFDDPQTPEDESLTNQMGRGGLEVTVEVEGTPVTILSVHFKSKLITYPRQRGLVQGSRFQPKDEGERYRYAAYALYRRTGEAMTVRERVNRLLAPADGSFDPGDGLGREKSVIVCGDLNDEPDAATTQILQGPPGSEIGTGGFPRGDNGDAYRLWNLAPLLNQGPDGTRPPAEPPYTRIFKGRGELIDHILASHRLVNPRNNPEARTVVATEGLPSVTEDPGKARRNPAIVPAAVEWSPATTAAHLRLSPPSAEV
jgi:endonuclease/exonuclease/phosphatase family metal-dependent hydrolase